MPRFQNICSFNRSLSYLQRKVANEHLNVGFHLDKLAITSISNPSNGVDSKLQSSQSTLEKSLDLIKAKIERNNARMEKRSTSSFCACLKNYLSKRDSIRVIQLNRLKKVSEDDLDLIKSALNPSLRQDVSDQDATSQRSSDSVSVYSAQTEKEGQEATRVPGRSVRQDGQTEHPPVYVTALQNPPTVVSDAVLQDQESAAQDQEASQGQEFVFQGGGPQNTEQDPTAIPTVPSFPPPVPPNMNTLNPLLSTLDTQPQSTGSPAPSQVSSSDVASGASFSPEEIDLVAYQAKYEALKKNLAKKDNICTEACLLFTSYCFRSPLPDFMSYKHKNTLQLDLMEQLELAIGANKLPALCTPQRLVAPNTDTFKELLTLLDKDYPHLIRAGRDGLEGHHMLLYWVKEVNCWEVFSSTAPIERSLIMHQNGHFTQDAMDAFHIDKVLKTQSEHYDFMIAHAPLTKESVPYLVDSIKKLRSVADPYASRPIPPAVNTATSILPKQKITSTELQNAHKAQREKFKDKANLTPEACLTYASLYHKLEPADFLDAGYATDPELDLFGMIEAEPESHYRNTLPDVTQNSLEKILLTLDKEHLNLVWSGVKDSEGRYMIMEWHKKEAGWSVFSNTEKAPIWATHNDILTPKAKALFHTDESQSNPYVFSYRPLSKLDSITLIRKLKEHRLTAFPLLSTVPTALIRPTFSQVKASASAEQAIKGITAAYRLAPVDFDDKPKNNNPVNLMQPLILAGYVEAPLKKADEVTALAYLATLDKDLCHLVQTTENGIISLSYLKYDEGKWKLCEAPLRNISLTMNDSRLTRDGSRLTRDGRRWMFGDGRTFTSAPIENEQYLLNFLATITNASRSISAANLSEHEFLARVDEVLDPIIEEQKTNHPTKTTRNIYYKK